MKIQSLINMTIAAILITACSNEEELGSNITKGMLSATVEGNYSSTRAGFDQNGKFYWSENDHLGVTTSNSTTKFSSLELQKGSGTANGTFSGSITGEIQGYAVYPYNEAHSINNSTLTYNFPESYAYSKVDTDYFSEQQGKGNSFNPAMWGSIAESSVQMKHLGGVFCIKISKMPVAAGTLSLIANKKITGPFTADLNNGTPTLSSTEAADNNNTVTITFNNASEGTSGVFYVPVPTGTYDIRIKVAENGSSTDKINTMAGTYQIDRCGLKKIELNTENIDATVPLSSSDLNDAATKLESNDAVTVTGEISSNQSISIPTASGGITETTKSLSLEKVVSGASLTVSDANSSGSTNNSVDNFTLSIPNNETAEFEPLNVTITMPNTTVTLAGNAGMVTYGEVVAETAKNTLIIGENVTVKKLTVKQGNVRLKAGATIEQLVHDNGYTVVYLYHETDQYTLPNPLPKKFKIADAAIADMKKIFAEGGTYTLQRDMNIAEYKMTVPNGKEVTLNLNGKTLEAANNGNITVNGTFTLQDNASNGTIKATKDYGTPYTTGIICVSGEDAKMTMKGGYISAVRTDPVSKGQFGIALWDGADLTIEGGKIEAGWYAVSGNGNHQTQNSIINITGGELISVADYAVYLPQAGTTTISGGTIKGACGAIGMRSGTLNINDQAKLIGEGTGDSGQWGDGTGTMGYAVINIGTGNQNTYGDCTVNITGGTFIAEGKSVGIAKPKDGAKHNIAVSVTGGTFSDLSATDYIAEDGNVNIELNKDIEIQKAVTLTKAGATTTVNLNGHNIVNKTEINNNGWETEGFVVKAGTLNIKGEGKLECTTESTNDGYREVISAYGTSIVNLYGGSYKNYQKKNGQYDLIYAKDNAVVNIYGGTYESGGYNDRGYWVLNLKDADRNTAKINVYGGSFKNFNPSNHLCEDPNANFVAEGYQVICDGKVTTDVHDCSGADKIYVVSKK